MNAKKMNPRSLANLDPMNRSQGKMRCNFTILPETKEWLDTGLDGKRRNASATIDELVKQVPQLLRFYQEVKEVVERSKAGEPSYQKNSFSKGLNALKEALERVKSINTH
jgi:hypothetical protein